MFFQNEYLFNYRNLVVHSCKFVFLFFHSKSKKFSQKLILDTLCNVTANILQTNITQKFQIRKQCLTSNLEGIKLTQKLRKYFWTLFLKSLITCWGYHIIKNTNKQHRKKNDDMAVNANHLALYTNSSLNTRIIYKFSQQNRLQYHKGVQNDEISEILPYLLAAGILHKRLKM